MVIVSYPLFLEKTQTIMMPAQAQILCVDNYKNEHRLFALADESRILSPRFIKMYTAGEFFLQWDIYIGSFRYKTSSVLYHVFEEKHSSEEPT